MNTLNENVLQAVVSVLLDNKLTVNEQRMTALSSAIDGVMPVVAVDSKVIDLWSKSVSRKYCLVDSMNPALVHVSPRQLGKMSAGVFAEAFEAETVALPLLTEQDFRLATAIMNIHRRNCPSHCASSEQVARHWAAVCYEAIEIILGKLDSNELGDGSSIKVDKDYPAIVKEFGLGDFILSQVTFDQHFDGNNKNKTKGITLILDITDDNLDAVNASCDKLEALCVKHKKESNMFYYTTKDGTVWEIIQDTKKEKVGRGTKDTAYSYQFRVTKAVPVKEPVVDVNFSL